MQGLSNALCSQQAFQVEGGWCWGWGWGGRGSGQLEKHMAVLPPPALYPLALPINASITPHRHAEGYILMLLLLLPGHLPAKRRLPISLNVISFNVVLPQHWSMLSQHSLQVDLLPPARSYYSMGPTGHLELHSRDWDHRPFNSSRTSFRGHLILDRKTKTYNTFHTLMEMKCLGCMSKLWLFAYCFSIFYCSYSSYLVIYTDHYLCW